MRGLQACLLLILSLLPSTSVSFSLFHFSTLVSTYIYSFLAMFGHIVLRTKVLLILLCYYPSTSILFRVHVSELYRKIGCMNVRNMAVFDWMVMCLFWKIWESFCAARIVRVFPSVF